MSGMIESSQVTSHVISSQVRSGQVSSGQTTTILGGVAACRAACSRVEYWYSTGSSSTGVVSSWRRLWEGLTCARLCRPATGRRPARAVSSETRTVGGGSDPPMRLSQVTAWGEAGGDAWGDEGAESALRTLALAGTGAEAAEEKRLSSAGVSNASRSRSAPIRSSGRDGNCCCVRSPPGALNSPIRAETMTVSESGVVRPAPDGRGLGALDTGTEGASGAPGKMGTTSSSSAGSASTGSSRSTSGGAKASSPANGSSAGSDEMMSDSSGVGSAGPYDCGRKRRVRLHRQAEFANA